MKKILFLLFLALIQQGCKKKVDNVVILNNLPNNILDYKGSITNPNDKSSLAFSDQGAWFAYGFSDDKDLQGGFTGPFLMTQENGIWCSKMLSRLNLADADHKTNIDLSTMESSYNSYNSHLRQYFKNDNLEIQQYLFFKSAHTAYILTEIKNLSDTTIKLKTIWSGESIINSLKFYETSHGVNIISDKSSAFGQIDILEEEHTKRIVTDSTYYIETKVIEIVPYNTYQLIVSQKFIFPEYSIIEENFEIKEQTKSIKSILQKRINEKEDQLQKLYKKLNINFQDTVYKQLLSKCVLTLQNNWRKAAGELKHAGLFPSYHYKWFHGFWAWDSWKHAAALAHINTNLAKEQVKTVYDFMDESGFIADCIYRDTTIENHNLRNTKPPLSAWAIWKIYEQDRNINFLKEMLPLILKQHKWWYNNRDHDKDSLCEYGSTDGTLIAAKWESGMDNAVRFDHSNLLKNSDHAWSLDQESVDLNSYLYAEKMFIIDILNELKQHIKAKKYKKDAITLKKKIQNQFYDKESEWFYDTNIEGNKFIKVMGCEGWIPLWAKAANQKQAEKIMKNMTDSTLFNTKVPFQTLSAKHPEFEPEGGYWRGPNWLDQSYFGIKGLMNYGYEEQAYNAIYKIIHNAEGLTEKGKSIRENYNPITGKGLEAENFSWSASHILLLLINE